MARHTIAATVRGFLFALRADWTDPDCPVEIDASESVDAPPDHEWQETGAIVADLGFADWLPVSTISAAAAAGAGIREAIRMAAALHGFASAHFDDWRAPDLTAAAVLANVTITAEEPAA